MKFPTLRRQVWLSSLVSVGVVVCFSQQPKNPSLPLLYDTTSTALQSFSSSSSSSFSSFSQTSGGGHGSSSGERQHCRGWGSSSFSSPSTISSTNFCHHLQQDDSSESSSDKEEDEDLPSSSSSSSSSSSRRSMFHEYNKPIVLLGQSSSRDNPELLRLAQSLQRNPVFGSFSSSSSVAADVPKILFPKSFSFFDKPEKDDDDENENDESIHIVDDEELLNDLLQGNDNNSLYQWPDVIVIDTIHLNNNKNNNNKDDVDPSTKDHLAQRLYQDANVLSIYVNVEPTVTGDDVWTVADQQTKQEYETNIFVPFSDYELCLTNEGRIRSSSSSGSGSGSSSSDGSTTTATNVVDAELTWEHIEWELTRLLARARLIPAIPGDKTRSTNTAYLTMGPHTFFLSLSFPDIRQVQQYAAAMCLDVDAMEYRVDLLTKAQHSRFELLYGMQLLRSYCRPNAIRVPALPLAGGVLEDVMPIVYTVRTDTQAGTFSVQDEKGMAAMFQRLQWGLRGGVEVLDVESAWDVVRTNNLLTLAEDRYSSLILGSHHVVNEQVTLEDAVLLFQQCALNGRAHGAKVVLSIESEDKDRMAYEAGLIATELTHQQEEEEEEGSITLPEIPNIGLILGDVGQFSRIINLPFTPVTHESLPTKAAPGQLTALEIMTTRLLTKIFESKKYAILGHNIAYSVSPQSTFFLFPLPSFLLFLPKKLIVCVWFCVFVCFACGRCLFVDVGCL